MTSIVHYRQDERTAAPRLRSPQEVWAVATQLRRQVPGLGAGMHDGRELMAAVQHLEVNMRPIEIIWDGDHHVHDECGRPVFGVCETDRDNPGAALVSINGPLLCDRPDLMLSTVAHELGHVIFDVPAGHRHYRAVTPTAASLLAAERICERRANEFMGALLVPAFELHRQLLLLAGRERLKLCRAPHHGRPGCPIVDGRNDPDALAGVVAALGTQFGVSDSFIDVRLRRYGLVATMTEMR
ncbi:ImmA/IrrE family metallo-endopeptidase [Aquamicrobium terrae]|uniref:IrrE N-terminal-like domain-containing protein n=1 Tax=Aquamicrobium terrae TaxID=1324945 RepID=A0ABV2MYB8_9HYPH